MNRTFQITILLHNGEGIVFGILSKDEPTREQVLAHLEIPEGAVTFFEIVELAEIEICPN